MEKVDKNQGAANPIKLCHTPFFLKNIIMAKMQKFVTQTDYLWYVADLTIEQEEEYLAWENDETGEIEEPEWLWELDYDLVRDKPLSEDAEFELIED